MMDGDDATKDIWREKRGELREPSHDPARLLIERGEILDVLIVDRSIKGMRLRLPHGATAALNMSVTALDLSRATIHQVKVIWKAYPDIGVQVQSSFDVRTGDGPHAAAMRRLWLNAASASR